MPTTVVTPSPGFNLDRGPGRADIGRPSTSAISARGATPSTSGRTPPCSWAGRHSRCRRRGVRICPGRRPTPRASSCGGEPATPRRSTSRRPRTGSRSWPRHSTGRSDGPLRWPIRTGTESRCTRRISHCSGRRDEVEGRATTRRGATMSATFHASQRAPFASVDCRDTADGGCSRHGEEGFSWFTGCSFGSRSSRPSRSLPRPWRGDGRCSSGVRAAEPGR